MPFDDGTAFSSDKNIPRYHEKCSGRDLTRVDDYCEPDYCIAGHPKDDDDIAYQEYIEEELSKIRDPKDVPAHVLDIWYRLQHGKQVK